MIHYLLVRRDLPFGVTLAQLAHAAADSIMHSRYLALTPGTTVVVLGVRNEITLKKWARKLSWRKHGVPHTLVREPDAPWNGQLMAIGVWPGERSKLEPIFKTLQTFRFEDWTGHVPTRLEDVR